MAISPGATYATHGGAWVDDEGVPRDGQQRHREELE